MSNHFSCSVLVLAITVAVLSLVSVPAQAQGLPTDAESWVPSRTVDGQPDIQGIWNQDGSLGDVAYNIETGLKSEAHYIGRGQKPNPNRKKMIVDPADGKIPYQPWAAARQRELEANYQNPTRREHVDPQLRCIYTTGPPRSVYAGGALQILQQPGMVVILGETSHTYRVIPLDGRPHVPDQIQLWMGSSRGRWEGNTLVVETINTNGKGWFDAVGHFQGATRRVIERFTPVNSNTINYEATIEDPKTFTKPWTVRIPLVRVRQGSEPSVQRVEQPGLAREQPAPYELMENACYEGNSRFVELLDTRIQ